MSIGYSSIELLGYLGKAPKSIRAENGTKGVRLSLAVNRAWTDAAGERHQETDWFTVVAWERLAEACLAHLSKGSLVFVVGKPRIQRWTQQKAGRREQIQVVADHVIFVDRAESEEEKEE